MLIERVIRSLDAAATGIGPAPDDAGVDWLDLTWRQCARRSFRARTRAGRDVRVLLPRGARVRHRDVLAELAPEACGGGAGATIAVNLLPTEVRVAAPARPADLARLALELGNLHVPVQVRDGGELLLLPDGPTDALLARLTVPSRTETCRFEPEPCSVTALPGESATLSISRNA